MLQGPTNSACPRLDGVLSPCQCGLGCKDLSTTGKMLQPFHSEYNIPGTLSGLKDRPIMVTMATHLEATIPAVSSSRSCCHQIFETSGDNHEEYLQSQEDWGQFHRPWYQPPGQMTYTLRKHQELHSED